MAKVTLITNIPAPYREKVHELISDHYDNNYNVIYCAEREANREWKVNYGRYTKEILNNINNNAVHNNPDLIKLLNRLNSDIIIIMGFYPTMLYAYLWSVFKKKKLIIFTDGTLISESHLSIIHKLVRQLVFKKAKAFIGPSKGASELYLSYGIDHSKFFRTYLCINNNLFFKTPFLEKKYDIMFSGQFIDRKLPFFFINVAILLKKHYGQCKVLILGSGPLENQIHEQLKLNNIEYNCPGFIHQEELPLYYSQSKIFLFPTKNDPWGVVANEAMASGVPVITCEEAGVSHDLVLHGVNGYVLPLLEKDWANKIIELLETPLLYELFSENAIQHVQKYNFTNAAEGIINAISSVSKL